MLPEHPESRVIKESDPLSESGSPEWKRDNDNLPEHPESRVIKESDPLSESGSPEWKRDNDNY